MAERSVTEILEALARIETSVSSIASSCEDHEKRLRSLEQRGAKRWDAVTLSVLSAGAVGLIGYILGKLF